MDSMYYLIIITVVVIVVYVFVRRHHKNVINQKIEELGGTLVECRGKFGLYNVGPFKWVGKNESAYRFEYNTADGDLKEGWVKFSLFAKPDWRI